MGLPAVAGKAPRTSSISLEILGSLLWGVSMRVFMLIGLGAFLASTIPVGAQTINQTVVFGDSTVDSGWWKGAFSGQCDGAAVPCTPNTNPANPKNISISTAILTGTTNGAPVGAGNLMNSQLLAAYFGTSAEPANQPGGTNYAISGAVNNDAGGKGNLNQNPNLPSTVQQIANYLAANGGVANPNALYYFSSGGNDFTFATQLGNPFADNAARNAFLAGEATALVNAITALNASNTCSTTYCFPVSMDHMDFLGDTLAGIATEKAGIIKPGVPCATGFQAPEARAVIERIAAERGAPLLERGRDWRCDPVQGGLLYADARGEVALPPTALPGPHQAENAGIAIAALRAWNPVWLTDAAVARGVASAEWPARLQRLRGALAGTLPPGFELWLDGGHNAGAGVALAAHLPSWADRPLHIVVGMKKGKASGEFLRPLIPFATTLTAVAEPGQHLAMSVDDIVAASGGVARPGPTVVEALARIAREERPGRVLVCGSLYLAGEVLKAEGALPA